VIIYSSAAGEGGDDLTPHGGGSLDEISLELYNDAVERITNTDLSKLKKEQFSSLGTD
jgi:hypothetical protein